MPSNSYDYYTTINRDTLLEDAYREIVVLGDGQTLNGSKIEKGARALNLLLGSLASKDTRGEFATVRKRATLFLQKGQEQYSIGGSDHCTASYAETTINGAVAVNDTTIQVVSSAAMTAGDQVGVLTDSGYWEWHAVATIPDGTHYTIAAPGMARAAAAGQTVVSYTTALASPIEILTASLRDTDGNDTPIAFDLSLADYEAIGDKDAEGDPSQAYLERGLTTTGVWFNTAPSDASRVVRLVVRMPFSDMDSATDTFDCSAAGLRALKYALAIELAPQNGKTVSRELAALAADSMLTWTDENGLTSNLFFQPGAD
jgi:hypothetical protein